jgi:hypothetical protein
MARTHGRIYSRIWDGDFRDLSRNAQWTYKFLLSQADLNQAGLIGLRLRRWADSALDVSPDDLLGDLEELERARWVVVDHDAEEVLVRTFIRNDGVYRQPNVMLAAGNDAREMRSPKLRAALLLELDRIPVHELSDEAKGNGARSPRAIVEGVIGTLREAFADAPAMVAAMASVPHPRGSENPSSGVTATPLARVSPSPSPSPIQLTPSSPGIEQETLAVVTPIGATVPKPTKLDEQFAEFWSYYPRKVGKDDGRKAWDKARRRVTVEVILAGVKRMAADPNLPQPKFIPHPSTWLTRGGWDDDPFPEEQRPQGPPAPGQSMWDR